MKNKKLIIISLPVFMAIAAVACMKTADEPYVGCEPKPPLQLPFNVIDAVTKEDLFFSSAPKYQANSLFFFNKKDQARKDTIRPKVYGTAPNRVFVVPISNMVGQDTIIMKIGTNADDVIVYTIKNNSGECPYSSLDKLTFNGTTLTPEQSRFFIAK